MLVTNWDESILAYSPPPGIYLQKAEFPGCCGYDVVFSFPYIGIDKVSKDAAKWAALRVIHYATNHNILVVFSEEDQQDWIDLFDTCPYAKRVIQAQSHHGDYNNVMFFVLKGHVEIEKDDYDEYEEDDY